MARLKIKSPNSKDLGKKTELQGLLSSNVIYVTRIITTNGGFVILTYSEEEMDKIFNNTDKQLQEKQVFLIIPPQLKANRLVLIFRVNNYIFTHSENEIKEEILEHNKWIDEISQIYKFPNSNTLKITFNESAKAIKAQEHGIKLFSMRIPQYNIEQDTYHNLVTCMKCYEIETHTTRNCPQESTYKICSCCSSTGMFNSRKSMCELQG